MVYVWVQSVRVGGEGGGQWVWTFLGPPSRILLGHFYEFLNISPESSAQELSIGTLFEGIE